MALPPIGLKARSSMGDMAEAITTDGELRIIEGPMTTDVTDVTQTRTPLLLLPTTSSIEC